MDFLSLIPSNLLADGQNDVTATYSCTLTNMWSKENHPVGYDSISNSAHWSPPVLVAHGTDYEMWASNTMASPGVETVAETGRTSTLEDEIKEAQNNGFAGGFVVGNNQFNANDGPQIFDDIQLTSTFPMLSTITMAAPSPDWFTGIYNFSPIDPEQNVWYESFEIATYSWDAGTELGETYSLNNDPQEPHIPIFQLTNETIPGDSGILLDGESGTDVLPMALWSCTLQKTTEQEITIPVVNENEGTCAKYFSECTLDDDCCSVSCRDGRCRAKVRGPERFESLRVSSRSGTTMGGAAGKARRSSTGTVNRFRKRFLRG